MARSDVCDARSSECGCCVHVPGAQLPFAGLKGLLSYRGSSWGDLGLGQRSDRGAALWGAVWAQSLSDSFHALLSTVTVDEAREHQS